LRELPTGLRPGSGKHVGPGSPDRYPVNSVQTTIDEGSHGCL
jgi:hypothetical protein